MRAIIEDQSPSESSDTSLEAPDRGPSFDMAFSQAVDAFLRNEHEAALALFTEALQADPDSSVCLNNIRVLRRRLGQPGE